MAKSALPANITPAMIEAFLASKAAETKAAATKVKAKAKPEKATLTPAEWREKRKEASEAAAKTYGPLINHICEVTGGKRDDLPLGTMVEVTWVGVNKWMQPTARILLDGEMAFCNPAYLTARKKMKAERIAAVEAEREAEAEESLIIPAVVRRENEASVLISYAGWFKSIWFAKSTIERVAMVGTVDYYRIPAFKVRSEIGPDGLETLRGKQAEFEKAVAAAE